MNLEQLIEERYTILNGVVEEVSLKNVNSRLIFRIVIKGDGWGCNYADVDLWDENYLGGHAILELLRVLEVEDVNQIKGKNVRIAIQDVDNPVQYLGNIVYDSWYDYTNFVIDMNTDEEFTDLEDVEEEYDTESSEETE